MRHELSNVRGGLYLWMKNQTLEAVQMIIIMYQSWRHGGKGSPFSLFSVAAVSTNKLPSENIFDGVQKEASWQSCTQL